MMIMIITILMIISNDNHDIIVIRMVTIMKAICNQMKSKYKQMETM